MHTHNNVVAPCNLPYSQQCLQPFFSQTLATETASHLGCLQASSHFCQTWCDFPVKYIYIYIIILRGTHCYQCTLCLVDTLIDIHKCVYLVLVPQRLSSPCTGSTQIGSEEHLLWQIPSFWSTSKRMQAQAIATNKCTSIYMLVTYILVYTT